MDQDQALKILKTGANVYLTGSAGTGKTYLINEYIEYLRVREVPLAITASTGIAATHIGGQTIHSWSGMGIKESIGERELQQIGKNAQTVSRLRNVSVLIIDEVSMLSAKLITGISDILKHFRKNTQPFGGVQVILSGDFFQLPPVSRQPLSNREKFAFMAPVWVQAQFKICYLTKQYRQGRDTLTVVLSEIRSQDVSDDTISRLQEKLAEDHKSEEAIKLFTHNADVDQMNAAQLKKNPNDPRTFYATTQGRANILEGLKQSVLAPPVIELKKEARVMFVKNNPEKGYFNGSTGTIVDFDHEEGYPLVVLDDDRKVLAKPEEWTVVDDKETIMASYKQIPLRLAWAITVHKSQGMTLSTAEIDLSKTFEAGQGYVALSRLKSWEGLILNGINQRSLALDPLAVKADKRFQELSETSEDWINAYDVQQLEETFYRFVVQSGGTTDPEIITDNKKREKKYYKKVKKESTYKKTKDLIAQGKSLEEIAFDRDLSLGTIVGHLEKIKAEHSELDISRFTPDRKVLEKVSKAIDKIKEAHQEELLDKDGQVKLAAIHRALNGQVDYENIRLARIFAV